MRFAFGWPTVLSALPSGRAENIVYLTYTNEYVVLVSDTSVQLFTAGQHRIKVGQHSRTQVSLIAHGLNVAATWNAAKRCLACATSHGQLQIFVAHVTKDLVVPQAACAAAPTKVELHLQHEATLPSGVLCACMVSDTRVAAAGLTDGTIAIYTWSGKLRARVDALASASPRAAPWSGLMSQTSIGSSSPAHAALRSLASSNGRLPQPAAAAAGSEAQSAAAADGSTGRSPMRSTSIGLQAPNFDPGLVDMDYAPAAKLLAIVQRSGGCAICRTGDYGLASAEGFELSHWVCAPGFGCVCARIGTAAQLIAVGLVSGDVALYRLFGPARFNSNSTSQGFTETLRGEPLRVLSLVDWGHGVEVTGGVAALQWSADCKVIAVGLQKRGVVVWTPSGCRVMCSLAHATAQSTSVPVQQPLSKMASLERSGSIAAHAQATANADGSRGSPVHDRPTSRRRSYEMPGSPDNKQRGGAVQPVHVDVSRASSARQLGGLVQVEGGVPALAWDTHGYRLLLMDGSAGGQEMMEVRFAHVLHRNHRVAHPAPRATADGRPCSEEVHVLQADDRLLLVAESSSSGGGGSLVFSSADGERGGAAELTVQHIRAPQSYITANWPLLHTAMSADGLDIAVAGQKGMALFSRRTNRWRLFGDVSQEQSFRCCGLSWMHMTVVACVQPPRPSAAKPTTAAAAAELVLYPRYYLDHSAQLARYPLPQVPIAIDSIGEYICVACAPLELLLLRVRVTGTLSPLHRPTATITVVRDASIMSAGNPIVDIALVQRCTLQRASRSSLSPLVSQSHWGDTGHTPFQRLANGPQGGGGSELASTPSMTPRSMADYGGESQQRGSMDGGSEAQHAQEPNHVVLLRSGGVLSLLDMEMGSELTLSTDVECFWLGDSMRTMEVDEGSMLSRSGSAASSMQLTAAASSASLEGDALRGVGRVGVTDTSLQPSTSDAGGDFEMPWWAYGANGMQMWFPSALRDPLCPSMLTSAMGNQLDPELEFDREVYPIGISYADAAIVGMTQRTRRSTLAACGEHTSRTYPCFQAIPESQPVLPCLLRRLLHQGAFKEALALAHRHQHGPHFTRSLEWLLFTCLEMADLTVSMPKRQTSDRVRGTAAATETTTTTTTLQRSKSSPPRRGRNKLLEAAAELIRQFRVFPDVVVSVARKTDAQFWNALFAAVGAPSEMLDGLLRSLALHSAACLLLVVDRIEGAAVAQDKAIALIQAALQYGSYDLCGELLRYLIPPGETETFLRLIGEMQLDSAAKPNANNGIDSSSAAVGAVSPSGGLKAARSSSQGSSSSSSWLLGLFRTTAGDSSAQQNGGKGLQSQSSFESEGFLPGVHAWRLVTSHAWQLLCSGQLQSLARLAHAIAFLDGGLPAMLSSWKHGAQQPHYVFRLSPHSMLNALKVAFDELHILDDPQAAYGDVLLLFDTAVAAGALAYAAAFAILRSDVEYLTALQRQHERAWHDFCSMAKTEDCFHELWDVIAAVSTPAPADNSNAATVAAVTS